MVKIYGHTPNGLIKSYNSKRAGTALQVYRKDLDLPVFMLSAKGEEIDRVVGLELGADDYITKPFSMRELVVRIRNMLKRS